MVAKALQRPFYVAVESYKFARMYPLTQRDISDLCVSTKYNGGPSSLQSTDNSIPIENFSHPTIDFTPAEYITLLFTDLGVLTPAAVSDELIRLYQ
jgi:translation initiation factor eIF-2B subunit alpha